MNSKPLPFILLLLLFSLCIQANTNLSASKQYDHTQTKKLYLSGSGLGDTKTWEFYCSNGLNSGKWSKIEVPSQWELQGFGEYTYGRWYKEKGVKNPSKEEGIYRRSFHVPANWKEENIRIWFDGVMTDCEVFINGQSAGEKHQGGFYRFSYDITPLVKLGAKNLIEVKVMKHSDNKSVNAAERKADWWLFGGIWQPVWLEAKPAKHIDRMAVNTSADGSIAADIFLKGCMGDEIVKLDITPLQTFDSQAQPILIPESTSSIINDNNEKVVAQAKWENIEPWTPEKPALYLLTASIYDPSGILLHTTKERVGFRNVEFRPRDGIYLNGTKLVMKGINRHTAHPDGGRTTNKEISLQDALLIKEMNMNAVRSHYPPADHFLDMCDSLGLLYINELAGWQNAYDTEVGGKLVKEMVTRDVNHPCIVLWSNGNEGGWNYKLDSLFRQYDPQQRHVIHPWADFDELDTHHYPAYLTGVARFTNGYKVFMPTEFMHGMYDQGHGAGLADFWARYTAHPLFAGGFMWAFSDEAVRRMDKGGVMDSDGSNAPDGIVGPYREKEGSVYSVREIWSPIQIVPFMVTPSFDGKIRVSNQYLYTNLEECKMKYRILSCPSPLADNSILSISKVADNGATTARCVLDSGWIKLPSTLPGETREVRISLPDCFSTGDVLEIESYGADGKAVCTNTFPIATVPNYLNKQLAENASSNYATTVTESDTLFTLHSESISVSFRKSDATIASVVRETDKKEIPFNNGPIAVGMKMKLISTQARTENNDAILCAHYRGGADSIVWRLKPNGLLYMNSVLLNRASGGGGFDDAFTDSEVLNLGFSFSYPESLCTGMNWMGRGPFRVWKNRIPGANYGIWHKDYNNTITGEAESILSKQTTTDATAKTNNTLSNHLVYPEFKGYHANLYWATMQSYEAPFTVYAANDGIYYRVFTPEEPHHKLDKAPTMPEFPEGDISFLLDIPAIRSFKPVSQHGPQSQPGNIRIKSGDEGLPLNLLFDFR